MRKEEPIGTDPLGMKTAQAGADLYCIRYIGRVTTFAHTLWVTLELVIPKVGLASSLSQ